MIDSDGGTFSYDREHMGLYGLVNREWIISNAVGCYSSSTAAGLNTRKYHGLLVNSGNFLERRIALHKIDEVVFMGDKKINLGINRYASPEGVVEDPKGDYIDRFEFDYRLNKANFRYKIGDVNISREIILPKNKRAAIITYNLNSKQSLRFAINPFVNPRAVYDLSGKDVKFDVSVNKLMGKCTISAGPLDKINFYARGTSCYQYPEENKIYRNVFYFKDSERGDSCVENTFLPVFFITDMLPPGRTIITFIAACEDIENLLNAGDASDMESSWDKKITKYDGRIQPLVNAANSFLFFGEKKEAVIAGYHWFGIWGRDALISLPGLTLVLKKFDDAKRILAYFLGFGRVPCRIDQGKPLWSDHPDDGSLWLIDTCYQYFKYTQDKDFIGDNWAKLDGIIDYCIPYEKEGLIHHNPAGTWMDTLKRENAVEIQALWFNALKIMEYFANVLGVDGRKYSEHSQDAGNAMIREYWNGRYLDDCIGDPAIRPNQVIAASLDYTPLSKENIKEIIGVAEKRLLTPYGLRTLDPEHRGYKSRYTGSAQERDVAYHNGTVWPYLLGRYTKMSKKVHKVYYSVIETLVEHHIDEAGIGSISEVFDGNPQHYPDGCISQAWSVAEILRAYFEDIEKG